MTIADRAAPRNFDPADFDVRDYIDGASALFGATANVIMQLSLAPVGHGVAESTVHSGSIMLHPIKRTRTTLTYLSVAMMGDEQDRAAFREAVNGAHRQVRSTASSPVKYNAFDRSLQLWVAACLYWGSVDLRNRLYGPVDEDLADFFYTFSARLGTTLQVPESMWPADRAAFDAYWTENLARTSIDPTIAAYFDDLLDLKMLPRPVRAVFARPHRWITTGMLPPHIRDQLGLSWSDAEERRLNRMIRATGSVSRRLPRPIRNFPFNATLADTRWRRRTGRPLI
ncbi:oxygenase MpaB family protein [Nocardia thailandica]|uniref:Oxygenase MpaB family protein n=1 Tax=Nocardia thailandica TaxID=257275 RepID=A0ABW6PKE5_9NOCA